MVLNCSKENSRRHLDHWQWWNSERSKNPQAKTKTPPIFADMKATYHSLYPRSWTVYRQQQNQLNLTCRQFSPVIAHNYKESSYPVGVFVWDVENTSDTEEIEVSLMFTFQNGTGTENDTKGGHYNTLFTENGVCTGVNLHHCLHHTANAHKFNPNQTTDPLTFSIAARQQEGAEVTYVPYFEVYEKDHTTAVWREFSQHGSLLNLQQTMEAPPNPCMNGKKIAAGVCVKVTIPAKSSKEIVFSLAWDMPVIRFGPTAHYRRYTKYYGTDGKNASKIASDAIKNYKQWEQEIEKWQLPVIKDKKLPNWYKSALFNELYYIVDGGTVWTNGMLYDPSDEVAKAEADKHKEHFSYLEGHEYNMFNTYDVHFYASHALIANFPEIQLTLQRDFARAVLTEHAEERTWKSTGTVSVRKKRGSIPHDLGTMDELPFILTNAYNLQNTNRWKDLNSEFILSVWRDYYFTKDTNFLNEMWESVVTVFDYHKQFDKDGDGIIENEGFPDSTYDSWTMTGVSAFSGLLWLTAVSAAVQIAKTLGKEEKLKEFEEMLNKGVPNYEKKLWDEKGQYYHYDTSNSNHHDSIMADQLQGHGFGRSCGLPTLLDPNHIHAALKTVFKFNVRKFSLWTGLRGAVNGMRPDGTLDKSSMQSHEVWVGTTYTLAATMIYEGMRKEAFETAEGVFATCWDKLGFWFQPPEAYDEHGGYRSCGYMRPLAIWSMHIALQHTQEQKEQKKKEVTEASTQETTTTTTTTPTTTETTENTETPAPTESTE
jgi:non-lysosomal glucosylceramidase